MQAKKEKASSSIDQQPVAKRLKPDPEGAASADAPTAGHATQQASASSTMHAQPVVSPSAGPEVSEATCSHMELQLLVLEHMGLLSL